MAAPDEKALVLCKYCSSEQVRVCVRCESYFCPIHSARFSPNFCKECLVNLGSILDRFERTTTEYDPISDSMETRTQSCDRIRLDGSGWVFIKAWIKDIADEEIRTLYEFHYFVLKVIEHENEIRKVKRSKQLASAPTPLGIITTKETKERKVAQPKDMQKELEKLGIPTSTIKMMLQAANIIYKEPGGNNGNVT